MGKKTEPVDPVVTELTEIKKLLIGLLMQSGASQADVGRVLGINQSNVSRMFPGGLASLCRPSNGKNSKGG
jgi:DNA-directed RNA polymerase specialized sigma subunit